MDVATGFVVGLRAGSRCCVVSSFYVTPVRPSISASAVKTYKLSERSSDFKDSGVKTLFTAGKQMFLKKT